MKIGGLQKVSLIDFPAHIAAVVFTKGCPWRCPFCFNRQLVLGTAATIPTRSVLSFLERRKKLLDGVVITGGEPLLQPDLKDFLCEIKKLGYPIKLDTNGALPEKLKKVLKKTLVDYLALDFKAPLDGRYGEAIGQPDFDPQIWQKSLKLLLGAKIPFEIRTTIVPGVHHHETLREMAKILATETAPLPVGGGKTRPHTGTLPTWYWQNFQSHHCLDPQFDERKPYPKEELEDFLKTVRRYYPSTELRRY